MIAHFDALTGGSDWGKKLSLVALGVAGLDRAAAFYIALVEAGRRGRWRGFLLDIRNDCLPVSNVGSGFGGETLAFDTVSRGEVDTILEQRWLTAPADGKCWGSHSGYFADKDGHLWRSASVRFGR